MDGLAPQAPHHFRHIVLLEKADRGNACRTRIKAGTSVLERNAAQGKNWDLVSASFTQSIEAGRARLRGIVLFEDRGEYSDVRPFALGTSHVGGGMTRNTD